MSFRKSRLLYIRSSDNPTRKSDANFYIKNMYRKVEKWKKI